MSDRTRPARAALARLGRAALPPPEASDALLLGRFLAAREEDAFARLVSRHGPMVLTVCRRVTGDVHLADDAFQAAFLVLARRAAAVHPREALRGWLYGVAVRTARAARTRAAPRREVLVPTVPDRPAPATPTADPDALAALDEEIARLPERLRSVVLLCELDGLGRKEAATRLRVPEGTLSSRLATARRVLAARLRDRGVFPAAGLGVLLGPTVVPAALSDAAVRLASSAVVPPAVAELSGEVFRTMLLTKLKAAAIAAVLLAVGLTALAMSITPLPAADASPARGATIPARRPAPVPKVAPREGLILVTSFNKEVPAELFKPDGTSVRKPVVGEIWSFWKPRVSPDGRRWLAVKLGPIPQGTGPWTPNHLYVLDLDAKDGPGEALVSDMRYPSAVWSRDGTKVYGSQVDPDKAMDPRQPNKPIPLVSWVYDLATKMKTPLAVPPGHEITDLSPDGKTLLTVTTHPGDYPMSRTYLVPLDTLKPRPLTDKVFNGMRFSPDGKWVLGNRNTKEHQVPLGVVSVADSTERAVNLPEGVRWVSDACWSPDGRRIAYHWEEEVPQPPGKPAPKGPRPHKWYASRINVADTDGANAKTIIRREEGQRVYGLDWR